MDLEQNCLKKKRLIKDVLDYYRNCSYPLYIYQVMYDGKVKHVSSRDKDVKCFNLKNKATYFKTTISDKDVFIPEEKICRIFSVNQFVDDICNMNSLTDFTFPKIETETLYNLNLYFLCLDYKSTRDMMLYIRGDV